MADTAVDYQLPEKGRDYVVNTLIPSTEFLSWVRVRTEDYLRHITGIVASLHKDPSLLARDIWHHIPFLRIHTCLESALHSSKINGNIFGLKYAPQPEKREEYALFISKAYQTVGEQFKPQVPVAVINVMGDEDNTKFGDAVDLLNEYGRRRETFVYLRENGYKPHEKDAAAMEYLVKLMADIAGGERKPVTLDVMCEYQLPENLPVLVVIHDVDNTQLGHIVASSLRTYDKIAKTKKRFPYPSLGIRISQSGESGVLGILTYGLLKEIEDLIEIERGPLAEKLKLLKLWHGGLEFPHKGDPLLVLDKLSELLLE